MRAIESEIGDTIGSGYSSDPDTIAFLEKWIKKKGTLAPHTRTSWDTARRLLAQPRIRKLDDLGGRRGCARGSRARVARSTRSAPHTRRAARSPAGPSSASR